MSHTKTQTKLKALSLDNSGQLPLYMPVGYSDYSRVVTNFDVRFLHHGQTYVFESFLVKEPSTKFKNKKPQTTFHITDRSRQYMLIFTIFGDTRQFISQLKSDDKSPFFVSGELNLLQGAFINNASLIPFQKVGKIEPNYPGVSGKVKPDTVRDLILECLPQSIPHAAKIIRESLMKSFKTSQDLRKFLCVETMTLEQILHDVHAPQTIEQGHYALQVMNRIATITAASELIQLAKQAENPKQVNPIIGQRVSALSKAIPFPLTDEQSGIIERIIEHFYRGQLLDLVLLGDVGTGKSVCYFLPVAYVASAGCRAAIMLPNTNLAMQLFSDFNQYFPELSPLLVTGSSQCTNDQLQSASVLIGTTAMLFRQIGPIQLLVIDEQQKLSNEQCNLLCNPDTHKISVSATPIPRTTALATYGAVKVEKITHCHAKKLIHTRILFAQDYQKLVSEIVWTIKTAGKQALIVCSRKSDDGISEHESEFQTVERVYQQYEAILPGLVACSHGGLTQEQNQAALDSIKSGQKMLLISTTVIEIGVTLPSLIYVAVYDAQQFGLNQLHQIRGRLVRHGGEGWFSLYLPKPIKNPLTINRLNVLTKTTDGHHIAKMDLQMRGCGDISNGTTQHGNYQGVVRNIDLDIDDLEKTLCLLT